MENEELTIYQHAQVIAESVTNGQMKQARKQFQAAMYEHCNARALLVDIQSIIGADDTLRLAASIIDNGI